MNIKRTLRNIHRWGAFVVAGPFLIVILSGILLQLKKEIPWVQPATKQGIGKAPQLSFTKILAIVQSIPEADVRRWDDINRIDVRPDKGILKVRCKNQWEIQMDSETGQILQVAYRRSDLIESLHIGTWFHPKARLWIFFPCAIIVFVLWITGMYMYFLPHLRRLQTKKRSKQNS